MKDLFKVSLLVLALIALAVLGFFVSGWAVMLIVGSVASMGLLPTTVSYWDGVLLATYLWILVVLFNIKVNTD